MRDARQAFVRAVATGTLFGAALPLIIGLLFFFLDPALGLYIMAIGSLIAFVTVFAFCLFVGLPASFLMAKWNLETDFNYAVLGVVVAGGALLLANAEWFLMVGIPAGGMAGYIWGRERENLYFLQDEAEDA